MTTKVRIAVLLEHGRRARGGSNAGLSAAVSSLVGEAPFGISVRNASLLSDLLLLSIDHFFLFRLRLNRETLRLWHLLSQLVVRKGNDMDHVLTW